MKTKYYKSLRQQGFPARHALELARAEERDNAALQKRIGATGFQWDDTNPFTRKHAIWHEQGFRLEAELEIDQNGWWVYGEPYYGKFSTIYKPGALRHAPDDSRKMPWFLPISDNPEVARHQHQRAKTYGDEWWYVILHVKAIRNGVVLGESHLGGIETSLSNEDDDLLTRMAFEQADEAIEEAKYNLATLCSGKAEVAA